MEKKFILPAFTMIGGIIVWLVLLLIHGSENFSFLMELLLSLAAGFLIWFSAVRCRMADGPREGNIIRTIILPGRDNT
jgi:hypothetical protein